MITKMLTPNFRRQQRTISNKIFRFILALIGVSIIKYIISILRKEV